MLNEERKIHLRSQNFNFSKQPNLDILSATRDQSPSFRERQTKNFFAFLVLSVLSSSLHFSKGFTNHPFHIAARFSAEILSDTKQTFSTTESREKCIYFTPKMHLSHPLLPAPFNKLSNCHTKPKSHKRHVIIKVMTCLRQRDLGCSREEGNNHQESKQGKSPQTPDASSIPCYSPVIMTGNTFSGKESYVLLCVE